MKNNRLNSKSRVHTFSREKSSIFIVHFGSNKYKIFVVTKAYGYGHFFLLPFFQETERNDGKNHFITGIWSVALAVRQHVLLVCLTYNHPFFLALVIVFLMCLKKSQKGRKKKGEETNWALFWWDCFSLKPYQCPRGFRRRYNRCCCCRRSNPKNA